MENPEIIENIKSLVQKKFESEGSGHDWFHIERVYKLSEYIAGEENANLFVCQLAALLHDIADHKFHNGDLEIGPKTAAQIMNEQGVDEVIALQVIQIIREVSFKGAGVATKPSSLEGQVVQDADRLDAIGAIGVARAFAYGGHKNRLMYHPDQPPVLHDSFEAYHKSEGHTINHFYEKLLLLKDLINTPTGLKLAQKRHDFMEQFLKEFYSEWNVEIKESDRCL